MSCKNCNKDLRTDYAFCPACGGKVIRNRLTFKSLWNDVKDRYFNIDNTIFKTFWHLFTKPQDVVGGYINGVRKKYLDPMSYLGISLALSGFLFFLMRKFFLDKLNLDLFDSNQLNPDVGERLLQATFDYSTFIYLLYIPVTAIAGLLTMNKKNYLLPEYIVAATYSLAHYSIFIFPVSLLMLIFTPELYMKLSIPFLFVMAIYCLYVAYNINSPKMNNRFWRILGYIFFFFMGYMGVSIFMYIIFFVTGVLELSDFIPKK